MFRHEHIIDIHVIWQVLGNDWFDIIIKVKIQSVQITIFKNHNFEMNILLIFMSFDKCLVMIDLTSLVRSKYDIGINEGGGDIDV